MGIFDDKVVVVTGAAGGLGQHIASHFRDQGAKLALVDYSDELLQKTFDINFYRFITGHNEGSFLTPEEAKLYPISPQLAEFMQSRNTFRAVGTPEQVKALIASMPEDTEQQADAKLLAGIVFDEHGTFERNNPLLNTLVHLSPLTDEQVDTMWWVAEDIKW